MKTMKLVSLACLLTFLFSVLPLLVNSHMVQGCSFQGLDIEKYLNEVGKSVDFGSFCRVMNQAVEMGFYCVCSLLASAAPLLRAPLSLQVSNCFISVPSLDQCQALVPTFLQPPVTNPRLPVLLPPEIPILPPPASTPTSFLLPLPPPPHQPEDEQFPANSRTSNNSAIIKGEPLVSNNTATNLTVFKSKCEFSSGYTAINSMKLTLFLVVALFNMQLSLL